MVYIGDNADTAFFGESDSSFDFGKHGTSLKTAVFEILGDFFGACFVDGFGIGLAEIDIGIRYGCDGDENIGFDFFG